MLILSRKIGESIVIDGRIIVKIVRLDGEIVKLGIQAPADVPVHRQEVYDEIQKNNQEALNRGERTVPKMPAKRLAPKGPVGANHAALPPTPGGVADKQK